MLKRISSFIKVGDPERGDALPGAIVSALVSGILLLGLASVLALVVQNQKEAGEKADVFASNVNIDARFNNDEASATSIQPSSPIQVAFSTPITGSTDCKVATWQINNQNLERTLTVYSVTTVNADKTIVCNTSSAKRADQKKVITSQLASGAQFTYFNAAGRELLVATDGSLVYKPGGTGCVLNMAKVSNACPAVSQNILNAWESKELNDVRISYNVTGASNR